VLETEFVAAPPAVAAAAEAHSFEPSVLARFETALARSIGPLARVIVNRAAQSAADVEQLYRTVAASVPDAKQGEFARDLGDLVTRAARPSAPPQASGSGSKELPADVLAKATERLALYLGPVAKTLVKKTAPQAATSRDLYERLAQHIDDPASRERFLAAAR
jgi:serine/threonine-protein kinase